MIIGECHNLYMVFCRTEDIYKEEKLPLLANHENVLIKKRLSDLATPDSWDTYSSLGKLSRDSIS